MLRTDDIEVWVEMEGIKTPVYEVHNEENRITCFVASVEGKHFSVFWNPVQRKGKTRPDDEGRGIHIYLDGTKAQGLNTAFKKQVSISSGRVSASEKRRWAEILRDSVGAYKEVSRPVDPNRFQFAPALLTDDEDNVLTNESKIQEYGTIRVRVQRVRIVKRKKLRPRNEGRYEANDLLGQTAIYEKSKKAVSHRTALGDTAVTPQAKYTHNEYIPLGFPAKDFVFQYAPLEWLRAKGLAPPSDPIAPKVGTSGRVKREREEDLANETSTTIDIDMNDLDPEERKALLRMKERIANKKAKLAKPEPLDSHHNLSFDGGVIDLTGDDD